MWWSRGHRARRDGFEGVDGRRGEADAEGVGEGGRVGGAARTGRRIPCAPRGVGAGARCCGLRWAGRGGSPEASLGERASERRARRDLRANRGETGGEGGGAMAGGGARFARGPSGAGRAALGHRVAGVGATPHEQGRVTVHGLPGRVGPGRLATELGASTVGRGGCAEEARGGPEEGRGMAGVVGRGRHFIAVGIAVLRRPAQWPSGLRISGGSWSLARFGAVDPGRGRLRRVGLSPTRRLRNRGLLRSYHLRDDIDCSLDGRALKRPTRAEEVSLDRHRPGVHVRRSPDQPRIERRCAARHGRGVCDG